MLCRIFFSLQQIYRNFVKRLIEEENYVIDLHSFRSYYYSNSKAKIKRFALSKMRMENMILKLYKYYFAAFPKNKITHKVFSNAQ